LDGTDENMSLVGSLENGNNANNNNSELNKMGKGANKGENVIYLQEKYKGLDLAVYEILNTTLKNLRKKEGSAENEIIQAYINYFMLNRIFTALYNLMLAEECNLTLFQQFQLYCLRYFY